MAEMNSEGLFRQGHFTSSKRAMDVYEPLYTNLYTVDIQASDLPKGMGHTQDDMNIVLEGLRSISGLQTQPGLPASVTQKYKFAEIGHTAGAPSKTHLDITMNFELNLKRNEDGTNDNYVYKFWRKWHDIIYDPLTGRMSIKKNYICPLMRVTMQDKEGVGYWQWNLHNVFPVGSLPDPQLTYDGGNAMSAMQISLWCDWFDEFTS